MANLTSGRIPKATGSAQIDDSLITDHGEAGVSFGLPDGEGAEPGTIPGAGRFTISYNYLGWGEVDFWNLTENQSGTAQGFYFHQKTATGAKNIAALYHNPAPGGGFTELDLLFGDLAAIRFRVDANFGAMGSNSVPIAFDHNGGVAFDDLPTAADVGVGATMVCINSNTNVLGAVLAGGGEYVVIAAKGPTSWTVLANLI